MISRATIIALILVMCISALPALAQNAPSLDSILNEGENYGNNGKPLTSAIMANHYYKTCTMEQSLVFDEEEMKTLCGCNAAKMSEILTVQDFQNLYNQNDKGRDARSRMLAFAYAPCMEHVIEKKVRYDCYSSSQMDDILRGGKLICDCVVDKFTGYVSRNAANIILTSTHYAPMSLNPLEHYFTTRNYNGQHKGYMRQCHYKFVYDRDNK